MTDKMFKLSDKYANLLIEVWETKAVSFLLVFAAVLMLVETVLLMGIGIAMIAGWH